MHTLSKRILFNKHTYLQNSHKTNLNQSQKEKLRYILPVAVLEIFQEGCYCVLIIVTCLLGEHLKIKHISD